MAVGLVAGLVRPALADELIDLTTVTPPPLELRKIKQPKVRWLVEPQAETYCAQVPDKDGSYRRAGGCVAWKVSTSTCTIVTTDRTTHSVLGHLLLRCVQAGG